MRDNRGERRREAFDLCSPVRQQRRWRNQEAGAPRLLGRRTRSHHQQERQHLHRLAEAHVIRETGAQPEAGEQMQPSHAGLLIGAQRRLQCGAGIQLRELGGTRRPASVFASHCPATTDAQSGAVAATMSPGTCAPARSRIASAKVRPFFAAAVSTVGTGRASVESVAIDFDPASAHQVKAVRRGEQLLDLRLGQRFAVDGHAHLEVEQRFRTEPDGGLSPTVAVTCGRGGRLARQPAGTRTMTPAVSRRGISVSS